MARRFEASDFDLDADGLPPPAYSAMTGSPTHARPPTQQQPQQGQQGQGRNPFADPEAAGSNIRTYTQLQHSQSLNQGARRQQQQSPVIIPGDWPAGQGAAASNRHTWTGPPAQQAQYQPPLSPVQSSSSRPPPTSPPVRRPTRTMSGHTITSPVLGSGPTGGQQHGRQGSTSGSGSAAAASELQRRGSVEDQFSVLKRYHLAILVDDSPSMLELWTETRDVLFSLAERCLRYDSEGIDLRWMNSTHHLLKCQSAATVREAFHSVNPSGSTPTGYALDDILRPYIEELEDHKASPAGKTRPKPLILLVLTDGRADDTDLVKDLIIEFASRLDDIRASPMTLGIQFVQLGDDPDARAWLEELDDNLKQESGVRDIVDTTPFQGALSTDFLLHALLGSVNKRLDNR